MRTTTHAAVLAGLLMIASLAAGCGSGDSGGGSGSGFADMSAQDIVDVAEKDTKGVDSLTISSEVTQDGVTSSVELSADKDGNCTGSFTQGEGTAEIVGSGGTYWFKPDEAYWRANAPDQADQIIAAVGDKYVANSDLGSICDLNQAFASNDDKEGEPVKEGTEEVDGAQTIKISKKDADGTTSVGYVLADSPHYLVKIEESGTSEGTITISGFGEPIDVTPPADDEQIDISQLQ